MPRLKGSQIHVRQMCRGKQRETDYQKKQPTNDEETGIATHVELWRERKGRTPNGRRKKSTNDQGNGTAAHVEMWRSQQGRTPDEGRQEGTREAEQHIRMREGRYTPRDSEQEASTDQ